MAFLLTNSVASHLRSQTTKHGSFSSARRQLHIEAGVREKALLAPDSSIAKFKSTKKGVRMIRRVGNIVTTAVAVGACYEIYVKMVERGELKKA